MNRLAQAVKIASEEALTRAHLGSLADAITKECVSLESEVEHLNDLINLADGLEMAVVSIESITEPSFRQHWIAREQAVTCLKIAGLSDVEISDIFPSMESEEPRSAWEKFKAFVLRLWELIKTAAKSLFDFVDNMLKKSSLAEKAAMMQLRALRSEVNEKRNGLTIEPTIELRPAHRYLTPCQLTGAASEGATIYNLSSITQTVEAYRSNRDLFQKRMPEVVEGVIKELITAIDALALGGTDQEIADSVEVNAAAIKKAIAPMFPSGLKTALHVSSDTIPLIYDRVLMIHDPAKGGDFFNLPDSEVKDLVGQLGLSVVQIEHPLDPAKMGVFPALRITEIEQLLKLATALIDEGHSADQQRKWKRLKASSISLGLDVDSVLKVLLKRESLSQEGRTVLMMALNARQALNKWISAPFMQINTVNIRVVESLLALASDQLKNYELKDSIREQKVKTV